MIRRSCVIAVLVVVGLLVGNPTALAPPAALGQINQMIIDALRSGTNEKAFYPVEGWLADTEGLVGRTRFVNDLQTVKDELTSGDPAGALAQAELIATQPSHYFILTTPNETRDQASVALVRLIVLIEQLL